MMDFGTGPATSIWVADEQFPRIGHFLAIEPSTAMMDVARLLMHDFPKPERVIWRRFLNEVRDDAGDRYDLVTASYVLSELPSEARRRAAARALWKHCNGVCGLCPLPFTSAPTCDGPRGQIIMMNPHPPACKQTNTMALCRPPLPVVLPRPCFSTAAYGLWAGALRGGGSH